MTEELKTAEKQIIVPTHVTNMDLRDRVAKIRKYLPINWFEMFLIIWPQYKRTTVRSIKDVYYMRTSNLGVTKKLETMANSTKEQLDAMMAAAKAKDNECPQIKENN